MSAPLVHGTALLEMVQLLIDLDLVISKSYISSDGVHGWQAPLSLFCNLIFDAIAVSVLDRQPTKGSTRSR
jgi:hypothetical protein